MLDTFKRRAGGLRPQSGDAAGAEKCVLRPLRPGRLRGQARLPGGGLLLGGGHGGSRPPGGAAPAAAAGTIGGDFPLAIRREKGYNKVSALAEVKE